MAARDLGAGALRRVTEIATTHARWVLAGWVLVAALCALAVPRLEQVVAHDATPFLPASSPSIQAFGEMDKAFAGGTGSSIAFVVLTGPDFRHDPNRAAYYRALSARLPPHPTHPPPTPRGDPGCRPPRSPPPPCRTPPRGRPSGTRSRATKHRRPASPDP